MNIDDVRELVFDALAEPVGQLGCAGPPACKQPYCKGGEHDTGLGVFEGVIEVEIDGDTFEIRISKRDTGD